MPLELRGGLGAGNAAGCGAHPANFVRACVRTGVVTVWLSRPLTHTHCLAAGQRVWTALMLIHKIGAQFNLHEHEWTRLGPLSWHSQGIFSLQQTDLWISGDTTSGLCCCMHVQGHAAVEIQSRVDSTFEGPGGAKQRDCHSRPKGHRCDHGLGVLPPCSRPAWRGSSTVFALKWSQQARTVKSAGQGRSKHAPSA